METVRLRAHTSIEGRLLLDLPLSMAGSEVEVTISLGVADGAPRDPLGWPVGFRERFFGVYPDAPEEPKELQWGPDDADLQLETYLLDWQKDLGDGEP